MERFGVRSIESRDKHRKMNDKKNAHNDENKSNENLRADLSIDVLVESERVSE